jgi:hypothetical protein
MRSAWLSPRGYEPALSTCQDRRGSLACAAPPPPSRCDSAHVKDVVGVDVVDVAASPGESAVQRAAACPEDAAALTAAMAGGSDNGPLSLPPATKGHQPRGLQPLSGGSRTSAAAGGSVLAAETW